MGGECLQLLRVFRLKNVLCDCITSKVFMELKEFQYIVPIIKSEAYWDFHFAIIQALYPLYCLLHLADMKEAAINKVKYYIMQVDCLMDDGIENVCSKMDSVEGSPILMKLCDVVCLHLPEPWGTLRAMLRKRWVMVSVVYYSLLRHFTNHSFPYIY